MILDRLALSPEPATIADVARQAERSGAGGFWISETMHDPFLCALLAARETNAMTIGTSVAIAFARSPMTTALAAWDLNVVASGRFVLGLGTQIRAHIERRYSMPWSAPVPRLREYVAALQAIWESWQQGSRLNFRGDYYSHTLMTPAFSPGPSPVGAPRVFLAAVGDRMLGLAGEIADGLVLHPMSSRRYLSEVAIPRSNLGLRTSSRERSRFEILALPIVVSGRSAKQRQHSAETARQRLAFYASTPAYRSVLALHGWEDLQSELNTLSKRGHWAEMGEQITDEMLDTFAIVADDDDIEAAVTKRFAGLADRIAIPTEV